MAYDFVVGSSQYIEVASAALTTVPISMACWFNANDVATNETMVSIVDTSAENQMFGIRSDGSAGGDPVGAFTFGGSFVEATTSSGFSASTWHHACGVFSAIDARAAYIDGGSKGTEATSQTPSGLDRTSIGRLGDDSPGGYYDGKIAEVAIWNIALTDAEVLVLAAGYSPLFVRPQNLVMYVPLIRVIQDKVGALAFSATNGPTVADHPRIINPSPVALQGPAAATPHQPTLFGAHMSDVALAVDQNTGAPTHSTAEGTPYWDSTNKKLYVNNNGAAGWTLIGP